MDGAVARATVGAGATVGAYAEERATTEICAQRAPTQRSLPACRMLAGRVGINVLAWQVGLLCVLGLLAAARARLPRRGGPHHLEAVWLILAQKRS